MTDIAFHITDLAANSLRAGADAIDIALSLDGTQLELAVTDNGCGMTAEDARTAFLRHATSKLRCAPSIRHAPHAGQVWGCRFCSKAPKAAAAVLRYAPYRAKVPVSGHSS